VEFRRDDGPIHEPVFGKGRVHSQDMADKGIVGAIVDDIVVSDEEGEQYDLKNENDLDESQEHGALPEVL
jgi:hypothetical protein